MNACVSTSTELTYDEGNLKRLSNFNSYRSYCKEHLLINTMAFNAYNKVDVLRDNHGIQAVNTLANSIFKVAGKTN